MMSVIVSASLGALVCTFDVTAPEQDSVSNEGSDLATGLVQALEQKSLACW